MVDDPIRLYLQGLLEETFPELTVYFTPPGSIILQKPCIVYTAQRRSPVYANNSAYIVGKEFQITFISDGPNAGGLDVMFNLPEVAVVSHRIFVTEDVNHEVFTVTINKI